MSLDPVSLTQALRLCQECIYNIAISQLYKSFPVVLFSALAKAICRERNCSWDTGVFVRGRVLTFAPGTAALTASFAAALLAGAGHGFLRGLAALPP